MSENTQINGLNTQASVIFDEITKLGIIRRFTLVGGTALALQLNHRKSEDFDFMLWCTHKGEQMSVEWDKIVHAFESVGKIENINVFGFDHVTFNIRNVKFSFYASQRRSPLNRRIHIQENLFIADIESIAVMKMELLTRRNAFRDYYDIYCIFKAIDDSSKIKSLFEATLKHAEHRVSSKSLFSFLGNAERIEEDKNFQLLEPKYLVTTKEIETYLKEQIRITKQ
ncbi:MAG: nucleotidyl transferase AbiEii/AbiGii toxin family protein [Petrimonas sp.]|nr:nucleotidyl transferase AbiEii/AbiGii toxin family protein [Petrimonas sp.]